MIDNVVKKSVVCGTIILLIGASSTLGSSSEQTHNSIYEEKKQGTLIFDSPQNFNTDFLVAFNITFFDQTFWMRLVIGGGDFTVAFVCISFNIGNGPVAEFTYQGPTGVEYNVTVPNILIVFGGVGDTDTNLDPPVIDPDGGFISGKTARLTYLAL